MKKLLIALFVFSSLSLSAQRKFDKEIDYEGETVDVALDLASAIEVRTWDKSKIRIEASVSTEEKELLDQIDLVVERSGSTIEIKSNALELFKEYGEDNGIVFNQPSEHELNYVIYAPKDVALKLSSITGDVTSEFLKGDISIDLVTGNIDIQKFEGDLKLKSVTGKISLPASNTSFEAKTVMGEIYANSNLDLERKDQFVGQEINYVSRETTNRLRLNTVTGDIDLQ